LQTVHLEKGKLSSLTKCTARRLVAGPIESRGLEACTAITPNLCEGIRNLRHKPNGDVVSLDELAHKANECSEIADELIEAVRPSKNEVVKEETANIARLESLSKDLTPNSYFRTSLLGILNTNDGTPMSYNGSRTSKVFDFSSTGRGASVMLQLSRVASTCDDLNSRLKAISTTAASPAGRPASQ
jgi:hypothetical protein